MTTGTPRARSPDELEHFRQPTGIEHGVLLLERELDTFLRFRLEATLFRCDVAPVVRAAYNDVLGALG